MGILLCGIFRVLCISHIGRLRNSIRNIKQCCIRIRERHMHQKITMTCLEHAKSYTLCHAPERRQAMQFLLYAVWLKWFAVETVTLIRTRKHAGSFRDSIRVSVFAYEKIGKNLMVKWYRGEGCFGSLFYHVLRFHNLFLCISKFTDIFIAVQKIISWKSGEPEVICLHGGLRFPHIGYVMSCVC